MSVRIAVSVVVIILASLGVADRASADVVCRDCLEYYYFEPGNPVGVLMHAFPTPDEPCDAEVQMYECVRCGGTSECHSIEQEGACHIACGSSGGDLLAEVIRNTFETGDLLLFVELLSEQDRLVLAPDGSHVRIDGTSNGCGMPSLTGLTVEVPVSFRQPGVLGLAGGSARDLNRFASTEQ